MAEVNIGNFEENAKLFVEKMGFPHDSEGLELTEEQLTNFLLLCMQEMIMPDEEEMEDEHMDGDVKVKVMKVDSGDMRGMMDEILGHGGPKVSM
jgi:hypothetical protein|tara:strand:- start:860 stop:1141 length:282 start_codon:yes stop_codon:yes gene_type:complete